MIRDIGSSAISGQASPAAFLPAARKAVLAPSPARCAGAARTRGEPIAASAAPYGRYLLLEVPGSRGCGTEPAAALLSCADDLPKAEARDTAIAFPASGRNAGHLT